MDPYFIQMSNFILQSAKILHIVESGIYFLRSVEFLSIFREMKNRACARFFTIVKCISSAMRSCRAEPYRSLDAGLLDVLSSGISPLLLMLVMAPVSAETMI